MTIMKRKVHPLPRLKFRGYRMFVNWGKSIYTHPNLWSSEEDDEIFHSDSIEDFLQALEDLTEV